MPHILSFSGPSGVGKNALINELRQIIRPSIVSVSWTTRAPRPGEKNGIHYTFVSPEKFDDNIDQNGFIEWANVGDNKYGTPIGPIENAVQERKRVFIDLDVQGASNLRLIAREKGWRLFDAFIKPDSIESLERRLRRRGTENDAQIKRRLALAESELAREHEFRHSFTNSDGGLDECVTDILEGFERFMPARC